MSAIEQWHEVMKVGGKEGALKLDSLLHDDVIFYSPVVFTPQKGKKITMLYLSAASGVFGDQKSTNNSEKKQSKFKTSSPCNLRFFFQWSAPVIDCRFDLVEKSR